MVNIWKWAISTIFCFIVNIVSPQAIVCGRNPLSPIMHSFFSDLPPSPALSKCGTEIRGGWYCEFLFIGRRLKNSAKVSSNAAKNSFDFWTDFKPMGNLFLDQQSVTYLCNLVCFHERLIHHKWNGTWYLV